MDKLLAILESVERGELKIGNAEQQILNIFSEKVSMPTEHEVDSQSFNMFKHSTRNFKGDLVSFQLGFHECWLWLMTRK